MEIGPPHVGFDPALVRYPTRTLPLRQVIDLLDVTHAPERIEAYRQRMAAGDLFPPVSVIVIGSWVLVADGHKRLSAYRAIGRETVVVEVWPISRWFSNQGRQLLDNARKNARILRLLVTDPPAARLQALATLGHWRRVAVSLFRRARGLS